MLAAFVIFRTAGVLYFKNYIARETAGTTWMQQIVYEIFYKRKGDLSDAGHRHLYAASPWIEAVDGVSMDEAPLHGAKGRRIIKTHLPANSVLTAKRRNTST